MRDTDYAFCVARLRANERYMLSKGDLERLCENKTYDNALAFLNEKGWTKSKGSIDEVISCESKRLWELLKESVPDKNELNILLVQNDFFNIKAAVKCHFAGCDAENYYIYPTSLDTEELREKVNSHAFDKIGGIMGECTEKSYKAACLTENGQNADIIVDCAAVGVLKKYAEKNKNSLLSEVCAFICDTANLKTAFRCAKAKKGEDFVNMAIGECCFLDRELLIKAATKDETAVKEYLSKTAYSNLSEIYSQNAAEYEKKCDEEIINLIKKAKLTAFGFAPVCAYYFAKQTELKTVRIILTGILGGLDKEKIKERVRVTYV